LAYTASSDSVDVVLVEKVTSVLADAFVPTGEVALNEGVFVPAGEVVLKEGVIVPTGEVVLKEGVIVPTGEVVLKEGVLVADVLVGDASNEIGTFVYIAYIYEHTLFCICIHMHLY
jgi:hypothetical protein